MTGRSLRVLLLYDQVYPYQLGGVEHRNRELAKALAGRGHRVVLAGWAPPEPEAGGVEVRPIGARTQLYGHTGRRRIGPVLRYAWQIGSVDLREFDLIETASIPHLHLPYLGLRCRLARRPLLVTWYELWGLRYWLGYAGLTGLIGALAERMALGVGRLAASSELTRSRLRARRPGAEVSLLPIGCDVARVRRAANGATSGAPLIHAGRLVPEKRVDLLIRAMDRIRHRAPRTAENGPLLDIIGEGPELGRLETLARACGVGSLVRFRGRLDTADDLWTALGAARIALQPSSREGFGMFPLEAMAAGVPVVYCSSSESAVRDLVRNGIEGVEVAPDPDAVADAVIRLLDDQSLWTRLRDASLERADAHDWSVLAAHTEELFLAVAAAGS